MTARASQFDLVLTERMGHAKELAAQAQGYRTVIALGGDGVIHEVVNGLMTQEEDARPALAILPVGSGNDFAQTLGIDDFSGKDFDDRPHALGRRPVKADCHGVVAIT